MIFRGRARARRAAASPDVDALWASILREPIASVREELAALGLADAGDRIRSRWLRSFGPVPAAAPAAAPAVRRRERAAEEAPWEIWLAARLRGEGPALPVGFDPEDVTHVERLAALLLPLLRTSEAPRAWRLIYWSSGRHVMHLARRLVQRMPIALSPEELAAQWYKCLIARKGRGVRRRCSLLKGARRSMLRAVRVHLRRAEAARAMSAWVQGLSRPAMLCHALGARRPERRPVPLPSRRVAAGSHGLYRELCRQLMEGMPAAA